MTQLSPTNDECPHKRQKMGTWAPQSWRRQRGPPQSLQRERGPPTLRGQPPGFQTWGACGCCVRPHGGPQDSPGDQHPTARCQAEPPRGAGSFIHSFTRQPPGLTGGATGPPLAPMALGAHAASHGAPGSRGDAAAGTQAPTPDAPLLGPPPAPEQLVWLLGGLGMQIRNGRCPWPCPGSSPPSG